MSSKVVISAEDYEFLESYQRAAAQAVYNSYGELIGYRVYDSTANIIRRRKMELNDALIRQGKKLNDVMKQMDEQSEQMNRLISQKIDTSLKQFQEKTQYDNQMSIQNSSSKFIEASHQVSHIISKTQTDFLEHYQTKIGELMNDLRSEANKTLTDMTDELSSLKNDIALQKKKESQYATTYLEQAKLSLKELKEIYDEKCHEIDIIHNLENDIEKCEINFRNGMYTTVIANAITLQSDCYEEILNFDKQRQEYNGLLQEASYHIQYLLQYSTERMKIKEEVLDAVNEISEGKKLSKRMVKKDLHFFSPNHAIDMNMALLNHYKEKLEKHEFSLVELKEELQNIKRLYQTINDTFNDAVCYYGNYLERETFLNSIIDTFEEHGRVYINSCIGENNDKSDLTQPIFALFEDETTGSEFMIEINYLGSPSTKLESEFHVHRIKGDKDNQFENDETERLVHIAIDDGNEDAIHSGVGCQKNTMGELSNDARIMKVRRRM